MSKTNKEVMMPLKKISGHEIEHNMTNEITIVNFYADWCGPCKMMAPVFEKVATKPGVTVLKINIDGEGNKDVAKQYNVEGIPATFIFKHKVKKLSEVGYMPEEVLESKIASL